jgi:hypothetical protein
LVEYVARAVEYRRFGVNLRGRAAWKI